MPDFPVSEDFVRSANAIQLHDESRGTKRSWSASFTLVGGQWVYRVERADIDAEAVRAALANHKPDPLYGRTPEDVRLGELRAKAMLTPPEQAEAVRLLLKRTA